MLVVAPAALALRECACRSGPKRRALNGACRRRPVDSRTGVTWPGGAHKSRTTPPRSAHARVSPRHGWRRPVAEPVSSWRFSSRNHSPVAARTISIALAFCHVCSLEPPQTLKRRTATWCGRRSLVTELLRHAATRRSGHCCNPAGVRTPRTHRWQPRFYPGGPRDAWMRRRAG